MTTCSTTPLCPTNACPMASRSRASSSAALAMVLDSAFASVSIRRPVVVAEYLASRCLEERNGAAQLVGTARAGVVDGLRQRIGGEARGTRQPTDALSAREAGKGADAPRGRCEEGAHGGRVQGLPVADAQQKLSGTADLLGKGATGALGRCHRWPESRRRAPEREDQRPEQQHDDRGAESPAESEERGVILIGEEIDFVACAELCGCYEERRIRALEQIAIGERLAVDDRDAAAPDCDPQRLRTRGVGHLPDGSTGAGEEAVAIDST